MSKKKKASTTKNKKLRIAFIGAGGIAGTHMKHLATMDDVEIVAFADLDKETMHKHAETYGVEVNNCYTDWKEMLELVKPDAVSVCTPNKLHAAASIDALKAGAHVIVEKPMAASAADAEKMVAAAKEAKKKLVIGFQYRFAAKTAFLRNAIDEGMFGKVMYCRVQALRRRGIPNWGVFYSKAAQGGGPMIDIGVHCLEMAHFTMGSPKPVTAVGNTFTYLGNKDSTKVESQWKGWNWKELDIEDLAVGQIRFDNGAVLTIESSFAAHIKENIWNFEIMGEKAGGCWNPPAIYTDQAGHMVNTEPKWLPADGFQDMFFKKMRNFVDHALHNQPTMAPAEHGLMVQRMLEGIYKSAEQGGKEVKIG